MQAKIGRRTKYVIAGAAILAVGAGSVWLSLSGALAMIGDAGALRAWVQSFGMWSPIVIVSVMVIAIVMSPIPSGPIAVVAGAVFGPLWGTFYVATGATLGAVIAFMIARTLGYDAVKRWSKTGPLVERLKADRSQTWLMAIIFGSRLVPFISFDAVSYAAGLTPLAFWRFALATLAGVLPISFLLAFFGEGIAASDSPYTILAVVVVGGITLVPLGLKLLGTWKKRQ